jgi:trehalose 2-sulfotransferase
MTRLVRCAGACAETLNKGYAICGEPRSGSTYLTRILGSTGVLGRPVEVAAADLTAAARQDPGNGLSSAVRATLTPNGVYGLKIFSYQFDLAGNVPWAVALPALSFVHLERLDLLGQAISHVRALQTDQYERAREARGPSRYDGRAIGRAMLQIAHNQARWRVWFARNGLTPLHLTYEEVVADPQAVAEAVARHVGLETMPTIDLGRVPIQVQRDELSDAWRRRFLAERGDLSYLDDQLWRTRARVRRWYGSIRRA